MLVLICQVFEFLPIPAGELYADDKDFYGVEYWYNEAVKINEKNAKAMNRKK